MIYRVCLLAMVAIVAGCGGDGSAAAEVEQVSCSLDRAALEEANWRQTGEASTLARCKHELQQVAARGGPDACAAHVRFALLDGESRRDPKFAYLALSDLRRGAGPACVAPIDEALAKLSAYRPSASESVAHEAAMVASGLAPIEKSVARAGVQAVSVEHFQATDHARVVIRFDAPIEYRVSDESAFGKGAIAIDFTGATPTFEPRSLALTGIARRFNIEAGPSGMRVLIEPHSKLQQRVFHLPDPFRVVIDLARKITASRNPRQLQRVMLDPGHGGHDPGAIGGAGLREKDVALDIAHRVAPLLSKHGVSVSLTRDDDRFVSLEERTLRANAFNADLFVSIHCNASESRAQHGVETYVLDTSRDSVANLVAARENASSPAASAELGEILSNMRMADQSQRSVRFGTLLQRSAVAALGLEHPHVRDGGMKPAAFNVLVGARMPSVLFEASYISNPLEESWLATERYRARLADAIVNAVRAYREGR